MLYLKEYEPDILSMHYTQDKWRAKTSTRAAMYVGASGRALKNKGSQALVLSVSGEPRFGSQAPKIVAFSAGPPRAT